MLRQVQLLAHPTTKYGVLDLEIQATFQRAWLLFDVDRPTSARSDRAFDGLVCSVRAMDRR